MDEKVDDDPWGRIKPGDVLKRQGGLQREVNANTRAIGARRAEIKRAMELADARWASFLSHEFADHEKRILALETAQQFWADDSNVEGEITRLGLVRLTDDERAVFTDDIASKVFEKQVEEHKRVLDERSGQRSRIMDQWWARVFGYAGAGWILYQLLFGQTPLVPAVKHFLGIR